MRYSYVKQLLLAFCPLRDQLAKCACLVEVSLGWGTARLQPQLYELRPSLLTRFWWMHITSGCLDRANLCARFHRPSWSLLPWLCSRLLTPFLQRQLSQMLKPLPSMPFQRVFHHWRRLWVGACWQQAACQLPFPDSSPAFRMSLQLSVS